MANSFNNLFSNNSNNSRKNKRFRSLRIEELEGRDLLSASPLGSVMFDVADPTDTVLLYTPTAPVAVASAATVTPTEVTDDSVTFNVPDTILVAGGNYVITCYETVGGNEVVKEQKAIIADTDVEFAGLDPSTEYRFEITDVDTTPVMDDLAVQGKKAVDGTGNLTLEFTDTELEAGKTYQIKLTKDSSPDVYLTWADADGDGYVFVADDVYDGYEFASILEVDTPASFTTPPDQDVDGSTNLKLTFTDTELEAAKTYQIKLTKTSSPDVYLTWADADGDGYVFVADDVYDGYEFASILEVDTPASFTTPPDQDVDGSGNLELTFAGGELEASKTYQIKLTKTSSPDVYLTWADADGDGYVFVADDAYDGYEFASILEVDTPASYTTPPDQDVDGTGNLTLEFTDTELEASKTYQIKLTKTSSPDVYLTWTGATGSGDVFVADDVYDGYVFASILEVDTPASYTTPPDQDVDGSGFWSFNFAAGDLPAGDYVLTAIKGGSTLTFAFEADSLVQKLDTETNLTGYTLSITKAPVAIAEATVETEADLTPPATPGTPTVVAGGDGEAVVTLPTVANVKGYNIQWSSDGGTSWTSAYRTGTSTTITGLAGGSYLFQIQAVSTSDVTSAFSASTTVTVTAAPADTPADLIIKNAKSEQNSKLPTVKGVKVANAKSTTPPTQTSLTFTWTATETQMTALKDGTGSVLVEIYSPKWKGMAAGANCIISGTLTWDNVASAFVFTPTNAKGTVGVTVVPTLNGNTLSVKVGGLDAGTKYTVNLQAKVGSEYSKVTKVTGTTTKYAAVKSAKVKQEIIGQVTIKWTDDAKTTPTAGATSYDVGIWVGKVAVFTQAEFDLAKASLKPGKAQDAAQAVWDQVKDQVGSTGVAKEATFYGVTQKVTFAVQANADDNGTPVSSAAAKIAVTPVKYPAPASLKPAATAGVYEWAIPKFGKITPPAAVTTTGDWDIKSVTYTIGKYDTKAKKFDGTVAGTTLEEGVTGLTSTAGSLAGLAKGNTVAVAQVIEYNNGVKVMSLVKTAKVK